MNPDSYLDWKVKPTSEIAPDWRAPAGAPRRRSFKGALSALASRFRSYEIG